MRLLALLCVMAGWAPAQAVTFNRDIAPILFGSCAQCHHKGGSGPFALVTYPDAKTHASQIRAVTQSRYMPPWLPDRVPGGFAGEHRLTDEQIRTIARWVEQGAPEGSAGDEVKAPKFPSEWQLGPPDLVLTLPQAYTLQATGPDVYRNFVFRFPLDAVRYVRAMEIRPGNPKVVHHANVLVDRNESMRPRDGRDGQPGFPGMDLEIESTVLDPESHFLFWKPGSGPDVSPPGMSWTLNPGTDLILNMHLQPGGRQEQVQPSLGLYFTDDVPRRKPLLVQLEADSSLDIPAGASAFRVADDFTLPVACDLLAIYPHAHYLGHDIRGTAVLPDGSRRELIHIGDWDLNWQAVYSYNEAVFLPKGTRIEMRWVYDNSESNPRNPNHPPSRVTAGDRAVDEMSHLWLQLLPRGDGDQRPVIQEALMRKRIARDPDNFTAHFNLGGLLEARGDRTGAISQLEASVRIAPKDAVALNTLGAYLQLAGQAAAAELRFRAAIESRPDYTEAHYNLAQCLLSEDNRDAAIPELRAVVNQTPRDVKTRDLLAELLEREARDLARGGKLADAADRFREVAQLRPDSSGAWTNLGVALAMKGSLDEARLIFERALQLDAGNEAARNNLARVSAQLGSR